MTTNLTYLKKTSRQESTDKLHKFWPAYRSSATMQAGRHSIMILFLTANNQILKLMNQQSKNQSQNKVSTITKLKLKISVMSSMSAVVLKLKTTTKKLPKRPRKKTMIQEISLLLVPTMMKDRTRILASALPLVCQILDVVLISLTETTQLLLKFLVLKDIFPRFLRWILLEK